MNAKQSILLVDDDREFCKVLKKMLEKSGYVVTLAADGQEALDILSKDVFDLIFSDLRMPRLNGIELMEAIKRKKVRTPVVFITAYGDVESYMDLMNMGAFDYISKPVKGREILDIAGKVLETQGSTSRISYT